MPQDAPPNGSAPGQVPEGSGSRVAGMQAKLHRWAAADPGRRFDDLFNFVCDPATLIVAFDRVAGNRGANTPGVDGMTVALVAERTGVPGFLDDLRVQLKLGTFRPLPVRERKIPKPGGTGKVRKLGIPTIADRVVQAALKLVLEPIFEADFLPCSYGFRPMRRAHDAIAEVQRFGTKGYRWRWKDVRRHLTGPHGRWRRPTADGIELFNIASVPVTRYLYRGSKIPSPWAPANHA